MKSADGTIIFAYDGINYNDASINTGSAGDAVTSFISGANLLWEFGFTGTGGAAGTNKFFTATDSGGGANVIQVPPSVNEDIKNRFAMNVTAYHAGPQLLQHNYLGDVAGN